MLFQMKRRAIFFVFYFILHFTAAAAQVRLPSIISDNMVLQQQFDVPIWGWATPDEQITVKPSWDDTPQLATTGKDSGWTVTLSTPKAGGPYSIEINDKILENIMIGEVWICSGQSNMQWSVKQSVNAEEEIKNAHYPDIRFFYVARQFADEPKNDCYGTWTGCNPQTTESFSAVAYFFGRELHRELGIPIGLIHTSWGGTPAEAWTRKEILQDEPDLAVYLERFKEKIAHEKPGILPRGPSSPSSLYNAMIAPLIPFGIRGAIWYQGEANVMEAKLYEKLFPAMIKNWREDWGQGDFPFYYVQLAPFNYNRPLVGAELRDAQRKTLFVKNTGMAVTMDIGTPQNIHPTNKQDVGHRLALWALAKDYGKDKLVYSGPLYKSMKIEGDKIRIFFDHVGSGLKAKGGDLTHFEIAGPDHLFYPATARIDGETILVFNRNVKSPKAVRFAFHNTDEPNLFNMEGLPASSFRTDDWQIFTDAVLFSGKYDPINDEFIITLRNENKPLDIRYTTDGSEPTQNSPLYSDTLRFKDSVHLKARAFDNDFPSLVTSEQSLNRHLALGKSVKLVHRFSAKYDGGGEKALVNGIKGSTNFLDGAWQGFEKDDLEAVIDLGKIQTIRKISTGFLQVMNSWIFFPKSVEYAVSTDGKIFRTVAVIENNVPPSQKGELIKQFEQEIQPLRGQLVRVRAKNIGVCPAWHPGAGGKAWLFVDEVVVE